jgi:hypothetical protein
MLDARGTESMTLRNRHRLAFALASYGAGAAHFAYIIHALHGGFADLGPVIHAASLALWIVSPLWVLPRLVAVPIYDVLHNMPPWHDRELLLNGLKFGALLAVGLWVARKGRSRPPSGGS